MAFLDETGLAELWSLITAEDAETLSAAISASPKIETGSYTGTNSKSKALTFNFTPKVVLISGGTNATDQLGILVQGATAAFSRVGTGSSGNYSCGLSWGTNSVTITGADSRNCFNESSFAYAYCAIG